MVNVNLQGKLHQGQGAAVHLPVGHGGLGHEAALVLIHVGRTTDLVGHAADPVDPTLGDLGPGDLSRERLVQVSQ